MAFSWPKEFADPNDRQELGARLDKWVTNFETSVSERFERYQLAQDVYDDKEVMSSLDFLPDYQPYNMPFMQIRIRSLVQNVCGGFTATSPYWLLKDGEDLDSQEDAQADLTKAFELAEFDPKVRQMGRVAAIRSRGPARLRYETLKGDELADTQGADGSSDVNYSGLVIEPLRAERAVIYPTYAPTAAAAVMVGHWFEESPEDVKDLQKAHIYDPEWVADGRNDSGLTDEGRTPSITEPEENPLKQYDTLVRWRVGENGERKWFRVIWNRTAKHVLRIEEYTAPTPNYFFPTFEPEIDELFAEHSPATRLLELQALINDAISLKVFGGAATAFLTILAGNFSTDAQTVRVGIGSIIGYKGNPNFTVLPTRFDPRGMESIANDVQGFGDGITGASQLSQGQQLEGDPTAREVGALAAGTANSLNEQRVDFGAELTRMAKHALWLLAENWADWSKYNKGSIRAKSAKCYRDRYTLEPTGKTVANTPDAVVAKTKALLEAATQLHIPITASTMELTSDELFQMILNALQFHVSTAKLLREIPLQVEPIDEIPTDPFAESPFGPAIAEPELPPEILAGLLEQLAAGETGMDPSIPPELAVGLGGGAPDLGLLQGLA